MLLFRPDPKPLTEIQVGESFSVLVTEEDWEAATKGAWHCAVSRAVKRTTGWDMFGTAYTIAKRGDAVYRHDGSRIVATFDCQMPFPGETLVTFKRER